MSESLLRAGVLSQWAPKRYPDKVAVKFKDRRITYGELDDEANRFANALIGLGLKPSDRVAVMLPNSIESFTVPLAMERAGLVYVRLNSAESLEEWGYILEDSGSVGVILDAAFVAKWKDSGIRDDREILDIAVRSTEVAEPSPKCATGWLRPR